MAKYKWSDGSVDYGWQSNDTGGMSKQDKKAFEREKNATDKRLHDESVEKHGEALTFVNEYGCAVILLVFLFIGWVTGGIHG